jgi:succinoglycan biosynthesis transport protein ExoP
VHLFCGREGKAVSEAARHEGSLRAYLRVVQRRKWILLCALVIVPASAVFLTLRQPPRYEASAEVLLRHQTLASTLSGIEDPSIWQDPNRIALTQTKLARVPALAARVLKAAGLEDRRPGQLLAASQVTVEPNADLLEFRVEDRDPGLAARLATEYARQFTIYRGELNTASLRSAREDLTARIDELLAAGDQRSKLYARTLIDKEEQLRTMETLESSNAVLLRSADSAKQVQPKPIRGGVLGVTLGLILGIGLALLLEALDTRVRSAEEIAARLGLPLLARIPEPPRRLRRKDELVMLTRPTSVHAEIFRMLRTNLEFANLERGARTIMITSAVQEEGKSTTAANLAIALARAGKRVVLVDLDLRRPYLARFFDLEDRPGLTQVALGHADLESAIAPVAITQKGNESTSGQGNGRGALEGFLEVLPSGPIPPDAGEFVGTHALRGILDRLRERADVVLIDVPPLLHVGDAMTLAANVDALVLMTRLSVVRRPMLAELRRLLDTCPATKLGFVIAGAEAEDGYGYGSGYYNYRYETRKPTQPERVQ